MLYTINELTDKVCEEVYKVYEVFKNFFGEDSVDLQHFPSQNEILHNMQPSFVDEDNVARYEVSDEEILNIRARLTDVTSYMWIMVYWPEVTVTNEHDKSIKIQDLYAKVTLTMQGTIPYEYYFLLNRATYPTNQFASGYMHSHICSIPIDDFSEFQTPCLGRGPIKYTIQTLNTENDEVEWMLFCQELALYVTVESLTGGPYNKLEEVGSFYAANDYVGYIEVKPEEFNRDLRYVRDYLGGDTSIKEFIEYYLKYGHLKLSYVDNSFATAMQFYDFIVDISNSFINWFNVYKATDRSLRNDLNGRLIFQRYAVDRSIMRSGSNHSVNIEDYEGDYVCDFKGRRITLHIIPFEEMENNPTPITLIHSRVACQILDRIIKVLNYRFRNERKQDRGEEECKTPALSEKVRYI